MPDSKSLSKARYTQFADGYVTSQTHARGSDLDRLLAHRPARSRTGTRSISPPVAATPPLRFAPHVAHIIASDLTPRMLQKARQFISEQNGVTNVNFQLADAENLPFERDRFHLVTCRIAPHHFPDVPRFLRQCARVLRAGGLLILQDQVLPADAAAARLVEDFERLRDPSHNRAFNAAEWEALCRAAGFTVEHSEQYIKRHDFLPWARRQGNDAATIARLIALLNTAPPLAREWMDPRDWDTESATFVNRHILLRGRLS